MQLTVEHCPGTVRGTPGSGTKEILRRAVNRKLVPFVFVRETVNYRVCDVKQCITVLARPTSLSGWSLTRARSRIPDLKMYCFSAAMLAKVYS